MSNDIKLQDEETSTPYSGKPQTLAPHPARISRARDFTLNPATAPPHHYDASFDDKGGESQRWLPTLGTRYAHAYFVPRAGSYLMAPLPHELDALEPSER